MFQQSALRSLSKKCPEFLESKCTSVFGGKTTHSRPQSPFFFSSATRAGTLANSGLRAGKKEGEERKKISLLFPFFSTKSLLAG